MAVGPGAPRLFTMVSLWFVNMPIILNRTFVLPPWTWGSGRPPRINQKFHRACICVCAYVRTYIGMYVCVYIYIYVCICQYVCMYVCKYVCMYVGSSVYTQLPTHASTTQVYYVVTCT